jgi:hypothetical protein
MAEERTPGSSQSFVVAAATLCVFFAFHFIFGITHRAIMAPPPVTPQKVTLEVSRF